MMAVLSLGITLPVQFYFTAPNATATPGWWKGAALRSPEWASQGPSSAPNSEGPTSSVLTTVTVIRQSVPCFGYLQNRVARLIASEPLSEGARPICELPGLVRPISCVHPKPSCPDRLRKGRNARDRSHLRICTRPEFNRSQTIPAALSVSRFSPSKLQQRRCPQQMSHGGSPPAAVAFHSDQRWSSANEDSRLYVSVLDARSGRLRGPRAHGHTPVHSAGGCWRGLDIDRGIVETIDGQWKKDPDLRAWMRSALLT